MVTNHDDSVFDHHPTPTRGFTETVNWALKHAEFWHRFFVLQKQRVVCVINACDNRPMNIGYGRVSTDDQNPEVPLAALHSLAGR